MASLFQQLFPSSQARSSVDLTRRGAGFPSVHVGVCALAVLLSVLPDNARAQTGGCSEQPGPVTAGTDSPEQQGLKVFIDPATGELISEPVDVQPAEAPAKAAAQPELQVEERPDGTLVLDLTENPVNELRVEKVDGKLVECHREVGANRAQTDRDEKR